MLPVSKKAIVIPALVVSAFIIYVGIVRPSPFETYYNHFYVTCDDSKITQVSRARHGTAKGCKPALQKDRTVENRPIIRDNNNPFKPLPLQSDEVTDDPLEIENGKLADKRPTIWTDEPVTDPPSIHGEISTGYGDGKTAETSPTKWNEEDPYYTPGGRLTPGNSMFTRKQLEESKFLSDNISAFVVRRSLNVSGASHPVDIMKLGPFQFLPNYRNPCWKTPKKELPPIRCLPYFYIIGAPKSGTTDLFFRIGRHQSVISLHRKESYWINKKRFLMLPKFDDFTNYFINSTQHIYDNKDDEGRHSEVFGDGCPTYLFDNDYQAVSSGKKGTGLKYTNADFINHLYPKAKIIAIFRNPIDRLYSDYLFKETTVTKSPEKFHDLVVESITYIAECMINRTLKSCVYQPQETSSLLRLRAGIYFIYMKDFLRVFPKSQILVLKLEDYSQHVLQSMEKVFKFLELEPMSALTREQISLSTKINSLGSAYKTVGDMLPKTRELLRTFYFPYNVQLSKLLGDMFNFNEEV